MSWILPKGIVVNTAGISGDIEKIDREPLALEEIAKLWKVYTTTKRRLLDPTAERLENYWWRIWGSRKRNLNGATVARLFTDISDGRSFVPLRGPPNRDESGGRQITSLPRGSGNASTTAIHPRPEDGSFNNTQYSSALKNPTPMPPPILKKSRGPSSTGPRPTARFISPHSSEEDEANGDPTTNSASAHFVVRPPTPELQSSGMSLKSDSFAITSTGNVQMPGLTDAKNASKSNASRPSNSASASEASRTAINVGHGRDICTDIPSESNKHTGPRSEKQPEYRKDAAGRRTLKGAATRESRAGKTKTTDIFPKIEKSKMQGSMHYTSSQDLGGAYETSGPDLGLLDDVKGPQNAQTIRKPKDTPAENSLPLPSTDADVLNNFDRRNRSFSASEKDDSHIDSAESKELARSVVERGSLFAKRPVQPAKSASALFASSSQQTRDSLNRSKSQLTLLLEKDRSRMNDKRANVGPVTSNAKLS